MKINLSTLALEPSTQINLTLNETLVGECVISYYFKIVVYPKEGASFFRKFPLIFKQKA